MDFDNKNVDSLLIINKFQLSGNDFACILNSIISVNFVYQNDIKSEFSFLNASLKLYKKHNYYSGKSKIPSQNCIVFNFYDFDYFVGYSGFDKIFINSIGQECLNSIIGK